MEWNKKMLVKLAVMLFLLEFTATVDARFDPTSFIKEVLPNGDARYTVKSTTTACCDKCICTRSIPPICQCLDVGETCHAACKFCLCALSHPPQCRCFDKTDFCYPPCSPPEAEAH